MKEAIEAEFRRQMASTQLAECKWAVAVKEQTTTYNDDGNLIQCPPYWASYLDIYNCTDDPEKPNATNNGFFANDEQPEQVAATVRNSINDMIRFLGMETVNAWPHPWHDPERRGPGLRRRDAGQAFP